MLRIKRATIGSETETGDDQSWKELMQQEDEYEEQLEKEVQEMEEKSKQLGYRHPSNTCTTHKATYSLTERKDKAYKFNCKTSTLQTMVANSKDISNTAGCVEAVFRSHLYTTITAMQYCYTKMVTIPQFVVWVDWDMDKIKEHCQTTKMCMDRLEIGKTESNRRKTGNCFT